MSVDIITKDCVSLNSDDLKEIAKIYIETDSNLESLNTFDVGSLSKHCEAWVLITRAWQKAQLAGFSLCTLERIGGTPCVIIGIGSVSRIESRGHVLQGIVTDQMRRAALSFPDEDVLFAARINSSGAFEAFDRFHDVVPRPDFKPTGEDRAWGKRLAKRFGIRLSEYEHRRFISRTKVYPPAVLDHVSLKPALSSPAMVALFDDIVQSDGDTLLVHGWVRSEELEKLV